MQGRHLEGRKYRILEVGRFWRIDVCIADSDILLAFNTPPVLGPHHLTVIVPHPTQRSAYTKKLTLLI